MDVSKGLARKRTLSATSMLVTKCLYSVSWSSKVSRWHCHQQRCSRLADEIINEHFYFLYTDLKVVWLMFSELRNQNEDFEEDFSSFTFLCLANCVFSFSFQYRKTRYCWSQTKHSYPSGGWHDDVQVSRIYVKSALELSLFWQCSGRVTGSIPEV